jgi:hypothetical protein
MYVSYNAIKTYMSLVLAHVSARLGHLQATPFFEETMYCTLIRCYFHFYYFPFFLMLLCAPCVHSERKAHGERNCEHTKEEKYEIAAHKKK